MKDVVSGLTLLRRLGLPERKSFVRIILNSLCNWGDYPRKLKQLPLDFDRDAFGPELSWSVLDIAMLGNGWRVVTFESDAPGLDAPRFGIIEVADKDSQRIGVFTEADMLTSAPK